MKPASRYEFVYFNFGWAINGFNLVLINFYSEINTNIYIYKSKNKKIKIFYRVKNKENHHSFSISCSMTNLMHQHLSTAEEQNVNNINACSTNTASNQVNYT